MHTTDIVLLFNKEEPFIEYKFVNPITDHFISYGCSNPEDNYYHSVLVNGIFECDLRRALASDIYLLHALPFLGNNVKLTCQVYDDPRYRFRRNTDRNSSDFVIGEFASDAPNEFKWAIMPRRDWHRDFGNLWVLTARVNLPDSPIFMWQVLPHDHWLRTQAPHVFLTQRIWPAAPAPIPLKY